MQTSKNISWRKVYIYKAKTKQVDCFLVAYILLFVTSLQRLVS